MAKVIVLGNNNLSLSYDSNLNIRDVYYPYIGDENHLEEDKNRLGFWVSGKFSWIDEEWEKTIRYKGDSLVSDIDMSTEYLNIKVKERATIHYQRNIYLKRMDITNLNDSEKEIRVFYHNMIKLYGKNRKNTVLYEPETKSILQYKKNRYFLFNGTSEDKGIYEFSADAIEIGEDGNFKDAEDGRLEKNEIAQGKVNSFISLAATLQPGETKSYYYWICAGKNFNELKELNKYINDNGVDNLIDETETFWNSWTNKRILNFGNIDSNIIDLYKKSLFLIRSHLNENGAIISSLDYQHAQFNKNTYNYVCPRESAIAALALDEAGYTELTRNHFRFLKSIIAEEGFLWQSYYPTGAIASTCHPWTNEGKKQLPIQEDQTALVLISLFKHYNISKDFQFIEDVYVELIKGTVEFLITYIDEEKNIPKESYDLWGNKLGHHFFTYAAVYEALLAAIKFLKLFGKTEKIERVQNVVNKLTKGINLFYNEEKKMFSKSINFDEEGKIIYSDVIDSGILYATLFENFYNLDTRVKESMEKVIERLWIKNEIGGCARYENDNYHQLTRDIKNIPGNPWISITLLVANYYLNEDKIDEGYEIIKWVQNKALSSGILSEQIHPYTGEQISVAPYMLSHSLYILVVNNYLRKKGIKII